MSLPNHLTCRRSSAVGPILLIGFLSVLAAGCAKSGGSRLWRTASVEPAKQSDSGESPAKSPFQLASHAAVETEEIDQAVLSDALAGQLDEAQHDVTDLLNETAHHPAENAASQIPRNATMLPETFRELSESEMLALAMAHSPVLRPLGLRIVENPSSAATIYDTAIACSDPFFGPQAALAEFDSALSADVMVQKNDRVFNNATLGGDVQQLVQDLVNYNTGWQKRSRSGAIWDVRSLTGYDANNRTGNTFPSYWETQLEAGVRQPLLQGGGRQFNLIAGPNARPGFNFSNGIIIAQLNTRMSDAQFEIQVRSFVRDLYSAYWDLVRQYHTFNSLLEARELSYRTWQSVLAKSDAKMQGGEANKEAQARAKYHSFNRQVQVALGGQGGQGGLFVAERRLRQLIGLPAVDDTLLRPASSPIDVKFVFDYDRLIARALVERTELRHQALKLRQQQLRLVAAKNFLLPQMDLIGRYRLRGLGDDLTGDGPRFASAYKDFFSFDHQEWEFGLQMGLVAGRRQARAAIRNASLQVNRELAILREQQRSIQFEISEAHAEVATSYAAMQSSLAEVEAARDRLEASESLYETDKIQIEFLLDAQEELVLAETRLASDRTRYSMSLIGIGDSTGSLLTDLGVHINQTSCSSQMMYLHDAKSD